MTDPPSEPAPPLVFDDAGQPRSTLYGDIYFSTVDGLAETRAVFLDGCGLPEAWRGRERFVVGELGFGSGLNIVALLDLWRRTRPPGGRLHIFSIEAHPIPAGLAHGILSAWPEIMESAEPLLRRWPAPARGFHRIELPEASAVLDLALMDVAEALARWRGAADAWFLDGFSPALNPQMWRQEVLDLVGARSAPDARLATFTVAGAVRRGLQAAGFTVEKRPGFGRKRERLAGWREAPCGAPPVSGPVAVIGAGIAGAAMARALSALGAEVRLYEAAAPGAGASGNPVALVTPRLDAGLGPVADLFAQALRRAGDLYEAIPGAVLERGVLQLARDGRDPGRFARIAASDLFAAGAMDLAEGRLRQNGARVVRPAAILAAWAPPPAGGEVARLEPAQAGWRLLSAEGAVLDEAAQVVVCAGAGSTRLVAALPLQPVRGQVSMAPGLSAGPACAWGGYALDGPDGLLFGATHDRDDAASELRPGDHDRNLDLLRAARPDLAAQVDPQALEGRASVRAASPDHLPLAGPADGTAAGLYLLTGLGSRGFCLAPLLAEHVAAQMLGAPSPLPGDLAALVAPDRFRKRAARRAGKAPD